MLTIDSKSSNSKLDVGTLASTLKVDDKAVQNDVGMSLMTILYHLSYK